MWPIPQETANLVTFTEEILNRKLHFLCSAGYGHNATNAKAPQSFIHRLLNRCSTDVCKMKLFTLSSIRGFFDLLKNKICSSNLNFYQKWNLIVVQIYTRIKRNELFLNPQRRSYKQQLLNTRSEIFHPNLLP